MTASSNSRLGLLRHGNFARLWSAATISLFGTQVSQIAIPFIAAVLLNASAAEVGLLTTIEFLPFLLFTLPAGVWVDRFPKKRILVLGDLGRAVMLASIPIAYALNGLTIWQLYVVGFVNGVMTVFFDVADQSYLPTILERDELVEGNSKLQVSGSSAQILGQPLGGGIVAVLHAPIAVLVDAVSFIASAGLILSIRERLRTSARDATAGAATPAPGVAGDAVDGPTAEASVTAEATAADPGAAGGGMRQQIVAGLRYIFGHEYLGNIAATTGTSNLFGNIGFAIFPVFAYRELALRPEQVGTIGGLGGAGVLIGALIASRVQARLGVGRTIVLTAASFGPLTLLLPLSMPETAFLLLSISFFFSSISNVLYNISQVSLRQAITPEHFLGRMNATMRFLVWGTIPVGSLIGAGLSELVGVRTTMWISAILGFFAFLPVLFSKVPSIKTIPTADPDEA
ncbi:MAG TPA: MFS transporter, partial [Candidatus Limnocylindrales bacterium]|nr:MFS transporter [Candidatus Limnocylindrales bacterium]